MSNELTFVIPDETIINKIYQLRNRKVMLDSDLSGLYDVETKRINEQVKRNLKRFPGDFMFQLTTEEWENLKSQNATSSWGGRRTLPYVFTEHGVLMLSSVLNSEKAIEVNIQIIRVFTKMRELLLTNETILCELEELKKSVNDHEEQFELIYGYLQKFSQTESQPRRNTIGYINE